MARGLASLPWLKALQCRLVFGVDSSTSEVGALRQSLTASLHYRFLYPAVGFVLWKHVYRYQRRTIAQYEVPVEPMLFRHRERQPAVDSKLEDCMNLNSLGVLGFMPDDSCGRGDALAAAVASGHRDLVAILTPACVLDDKLLFLLSNAITVCPSEKIVHAVVTGLLQFPMLGRHTIQTMVFSVCQQGYLSPLKLIVDKHDTETAAEFLRCEYGRSDHHPPFLGDLDDMGMASLHYACKGDTLGNVAVIKYLVEEHGIAVNDGERDQSWSPLHVAAYFGCMSVMRYLLEQCPTRAKVDAMVRVDLTPLILAIMQRRVEVVRYLLMRGADVSLTYDLQDDFCGLEEVNPLEHALGEAADDFKRKVVDVHSLLPIARLLYEVRGCRVRRPEPFLTALPEPYHALVAGSE